MLTCSRGRTVLSGQDARQRAGKNAFVEIKRTLTPRTSDQVIRENPASRGTETSDLCASGTLSVLLCPSMVFYWSYYLYHYYYE